MSRFGSYLKEDIMVRIKKKIIINEKGCWIWQGKKTKGYGVIMYRGVMWSTHRLTFKLKYGHKPINDGAHICRNTACCNPEHIKDQTRSENMLATHRENGPTAKIDRRPKERRTL